MQIYWGRLHIICPVRAKYLYITDSGCSLHGKLFHSNSLIFSKLHVKISCGREEGERDRIRIRMLLLVYAEI